jgi:propionyl-CoA carboxylase alpha chain
VLRVLVSPGDVVSEGQALLVLEALKMEIEVNAPSGGTVAEVLVDAGQQVAAGAVLVTVA